jgi:hypothetical protein
MKVPKMGAGIMAGAILAGAVGMAVQAAPDDCTSLTWASVVADEGGDSSLAGPAQTRWDALISAGWYGSSQDGAEALWAPSCTDAEVSAAIALR